MPEGEATPNQNANGEGSAQSQGPSMDDFNALKAELDNWKANARKHETRARENADAAKRLKDLETSKLSDQEKAIKEAVDAAQNSWRSEMNTKLVTTEFRAKALPRFGGDEAKLNAIMPGLNVSAFLDDEGNPNSKAIDDFLDGFAPKPTAPQGFDFGQGARGNGEGNAQSLAGDDMSKNILRLAGFNV